MAKVFVISAILFALMVFKTNNALMPFSTISKISSPISTPRTRYCKTIITYMVGECLPYFIHDDNSQKSDYSCCSALKSIAANDTNDCICDIMDNDNETKVRKLPTICGRITPMLW